MNLPAHYLSQAENVSITVDKSYNAPSSQHRQSTQDFEPSPVAQVEGSLTKEEQAYINNPEARGAQPGTD